MTLAIATLDLSAGQRRQHRLRSRLLGIDSPDWVSLLERVDHDVYHLPGYVGASAVHEGGTPHALYVEDGPRAMLLPIVVRPLTGNLSDATSPYGYPGPLVVGTNNPAFMRTALSEGRRFLASRGIVSLFVRLHPILNLHPPDGVGRVVQHGDTVSIDLSSTHDTIWSQMRSNHRRNIRRAKRRGWRSSLMTRGNSSRPSGSSTRTR